MFNRQMMSLVLQGEARTNKVLKKITATNIALCSQTCGMFVSLIPKFQIQLQAVLGASYSYQGKAGAHTGEDEENA